MSSEDRIRQVKTTKANSPHGADHYKIIGGRGGKKSPTKFTSETASAAAKKRWSDKRERESSVEQ